MAGNDFESAEDALQEANIRNRRDPEAWGWLALTVLKGPEKERRIGEAKKALDLAFELGLDDVVVLHKLAEALAAVDLADYAEACLQRALKVAPDDVRVGTLLGDVLAADGRTAEAANAYQRAIRVRGAPRAHKDAALGKLLVLLKVLGRDRGEAERATMAARAKIRGGVAHAAVAGGVWQ